MDIRNWPLDRIMQLPDWCFGRKWPISFACVLAGLGPTFYASRGALPERSVIWQLCFATAGTLSETAAVALALGDQEPPNAAAFAALQPLLPGCEAEGPIVGAIHVVTMQSIIIDLRMPVVVSAGRRIVGRFDRIDGSIISIGVVVVISGVPTEVPDWLVCR